MVLTRRNTLIGLGTLAGGLGIISGTGAFDTVEANRDFTVEVDDDADALLQLVPIDEAYVDLSDDDDGMLEISIGEGDDEAGVNDNAETTFNDLFAIGNNGTEDVDVHFEIVDDDDNDVDGVTIINNTAENEDIIDSANPATIEDEGIDDTDIDADGYISEDALDADESLSVGLTIDTRDDNGDGYDPDEEYTLIIHAGGAE